MTPITLLTTGMYKDLGEDLPLIPRTGIRAYSKFVFFRFTVYPYLSSNAIDHKVAFYRLMGLVL